MLTTIEKVFLLQDVDLFSEASTDHLTLLAELCEDHTVQAGKKVVQAGETCSQLYLLVEGRVRIEKPGDGRTSEDVERSALNFWNCLLRSPQTSDVVCATDSRFLVIRSEDLLDVLTTEPGLSLAILRRHAAAHRS